MRRLCAKAISLLAAVMIFTNALASSVLAYSAESLTWKSYVGDLDTFVYGLLVRQYELFYDVFSASMELPDGTEVYGIAYTDYDGVFEAEDGETCYFPAGFIPLIGEDAIPSEFVDAGLIIHDAEFDNPESGFVYAYRAEPFMEHCVIWDKYVQYGIAEDGCITYEYCPYQRGKCNEKLGALYSYDEERLLFNPNLGEYVPISGLSLNIAVDYQEFEDEINRILKEQDKNFWTQSVETVVYESHEALVSFLLSMQEERFFGYSVKELAKKAAQIDPMEYIRITPDGMVLVDYEEDFLRDSNSLAKWITGTCCVITVAGCIAIDLFVPALKPVSSAVMAAATEVFMQVVINNQALSEINWKKVAIASVSAVFLSWANPALSAKASNGAVKLFGKVIKYETIQEKIGIAVGKSVQSLSNSAVTKASMYLMAIEDGADEEDAINAARVGTGIGVLFSLGEVTLSKAVTPMLQEFYKAHPNHWFVNAARKAETYILDHQYHFKEDIEKVLVPKSIHQATKEAIKELSAQKGHFVSAINSLRRDDYPGFIKTDSAGNTITKQDLLKNGGNCKLRLTEDCDPNISNVFKEHGVTEISIKEGLPDLSEVSEYKFRATISADRTANMKDYYTKLANTYSDAEKRAELPKKLLDAIKAVKGMDSLPKTVNASDIRTALSAASLTPHEGSGDMVYLVDMSVHETIRHSGGVSLAKLEEKLKLLRSEVFKTISTATPKIIVSTFEEEEAYW